MICVVVVVVVVIVVGLVLLSFVFCCWVEDLGPTVPNFFL